MTQKQALKHAQALWGRAAVQALPKGGRIGAHGEFLPSHLGNNRDGDPRKGRYLCRQCSTTTTDDSGDVIERKVWHPLGGWQTSYRVGFVDSLLGCFHVKGEGDSFEAAFENAAAR